MGIAERKEHDRKRRQQQIMVAARRIFSERGYHKATMEEIAREAELSPGTLYLYFKNKDELYASLTLRVLQFLNIRLEHVASDIDPDRIPDLLSEVMLDVYEFDPFILMSMFYLQSSELYGNLSDALIDDINRLTDRSLDHIAKILETGIQSGIYAPIDSRTLATIVWSMFSGVVLWQESKKIIYRGDQSLKSALASAFTVFARGIRPRPSTQNAMAGVTDTIRLTDKERR